MQHGACNKESSYYYHIERSIEFYLVIFMAVVVKASNHVIERTLSSLKQPFRLSLDITDASEPG